MTGPMAEESPAAESVHLLLYDGDCGLCSRVVQFVLAHDVRAVFDFATLQGRAGGSVVARWGLEGEALTTFMVCANYRTSDSRPLRKSRAAFFVASELGWPWRAVLVGRVLPASLTDRLYDIVASNRHRLPGDAACLRPTPEVRRRFLE